MMQFDDRTLMILKNFNTINKSILIKPGNIISTMADNKSILASAKVNESFDNQFGIYDLSKFLGVISMFGKPDIEIKDKFATISVGTKKVNYVFADPEAINYPKTNKIELESVVVDVELSTANLNDLLKAASILALPQIAVISENSVLKFKAFDSDKPNGDVYEIKLDTEVESDFKFIFKTENMKMITQDYNLKIDQRGVAQFTGADVTYWVTVEHNSKA